MSELANTLIGEFADKEYAHAYMDEFYDMALASQIKVLREQRGWSQEDLAHIANVSQEDILALEDGDHGNCPLEILRRLAEAFDLTVKLSFESFSKGILDVVNMNRANLERISRSEDLAMLRENGLCTGRDGAWKVLDMDSLHCEAAPKVVMTHPPQMMIMLFSHAGPTEPSYTSPRVKTQRPHYAS